MDIKIEVEDYHDDLDYNIVKEEYEVQEQSFTNANEDIADSTEAIRIKTEEIAEDEHKQMPKRTREKTHKDKPYTKEGLRNALKCVRDGSTIAYASKTFNVPRTTLHNKLTGKYPEECPNGRPATLSKEQENELVMWIQGCADGWHPIGKEQILDSVKLICKIYKIPNQFANGRPGDVWFRQFLKRHPELNVRKPKSYSLAKAVVTAEDLTEWFQKCRKYFTEHDLLTISPDRVFNCDESAFFLTPEDGNVLARKGSRIVPASPAPKNSRPKSATILFMVSATGQLAPPMVIHNINITPKITVHNAEGWKMGKSPQSGWMDGSLFYEYITKVFFPWLKSQGIQFPVVLYLDGHACHVTLPLSKFCKENGIVLVLLYPNSTHFIQPLDRDFFEPMKTAYAKEVEKWKMSNLPPVRFHPMHVAKVVNAALKHLDLPKIAKDGFRECGLVPFNPDVVNGMEIVKTRKSENLELNLSIDQSRPEDDKDIANACAASDYEAAHRILDHLISPDTLKKFKECKEDRIWSGSLKDKHLFEVWCKVNERCESQSLASSSTSISVDYRDIEIGDPSLSTAGNANQSSDISNSGLLSNEDTRLSGDIALQDYIVIDPVDNGPIISTEDAGIYFPEIVFLHSEE
ncbi:uncharacterized protein LOC129804094 isoform X4 [Phlebotomus papatasi]|uniref:uncharacterized protein LOC129804094 isoform X4 n=1 Tax=Phlebotomus papatasi TaxID=29031 RepID=UPI002483B18D|nr:uncharacterized protein LOC129804094 isoform X4 [Phlebotomus papatasi]